MGLSREEGRGGGGGGVEEDKVLSINVISSYLSVILLTGSRDQFLYLALMARYCKSTPGQASSIKTSLDGMLWNNRPGVECFNRVGREL